jgi:hypothetical protein
LLADICAKTLWPQIKLGAEQIGGRKVHIEETFEPNAKEMRTIVRESKITGGLVVGGPIVGRGFHDVGVNVVGYRTHKTNGGYRRTRPRRHV